MAYQDEKQTQASEQDEKQRPEEQLVPEQLSFGLPNSYVNSSGVLPPPPGTPNSVMREMLDPQIPAAEAEADRLSRGIRYGSPNSVRRQMGSRLGSDFSSVRFHTDPESIRRNDLMGSRAYTRGRDVYFGRGGFDPSVGAHELVHTVQQHAVPGNVSQSVSFGTVQRKNGERRAAVRNFFSRFIPGLKPKAAPIPQSESRPALLTIDPSVTESLTASVINEGYADSRDSVPSASAPALPEPRKDSPPANPEPEEEPKSPEPVTSASTTTTTTTTNSADSEGPKAVAAAPSATTTTTTTIASSSASEEEPELSFVQDGVLYALVTDAATGNIFYIGKNGQLLGRDKKPLSEEGPKEEKKEESEEEKKEEKKKIDDGPVVIEDEEEKLKAYKKAREEEGRPVEPITDVPDPKEAASLLDPSHGGPDAAPPEDSETKGLPPAGSDSAATAAATTTTTTTTADDLSDDGEPEISISINELLGKAWFKKGDNWLHFVRMDELTGDMHYLTLDGDIIDQDGTLIGSIADAAPPSGVEIPFLEKPKWSVSDVPSSGSEIPESESAAGNDPDEIDPNATTTTTTTTTTTSKSAPDSAAEEADLMASAAAAAAAMKISINSGHKTDDSDLWAPQTAFWTPRSAFTRSALFDPEYAYPGQALFGPDSAASMAALSPLAPAVPDPTKVPQGSEAAPVSPNPIRVPQGSEAAPVSPDPTKVPQGSKAAPAVPDPTKVPQGSKAAPVSPNPKRVPQKSKAAPVNPDVPAAEESALVSGGMGNTTTTTTTTTTSKKSSAPESLAPSNSPEGIYQRRRLAAGRHLWSVGDGSYVGPADGKSVLTSFSKGAGVARDSISLVNNGFYYGVAKYVDAPDADSMPSFEQNVAYPGMGFMTNGAGFLASTASAAAQVMKTGENAANVQHGTAREDVVESGAAAAASLSSAVSHGLGATSKVMSWAGNTAGATAISANAIPIVNIVTGGITALLGAWRGLTGAVSLSRIWWERKKFKTRVESGTASGTKKEQKRMDQLSNQAMRVARHRGISGAIQLGAGAVAAGGGIGTLASGPAAPATAAAIAAASAGLGLAQFAYDYGAKSILADDVVAEELGITWDNEINFVKRIWSRKQIEDDEARAIILKAHGFPDGTVDAAFKKINVRRARELITLANGTNKSRRWGTDEQKMADVIVSYMGIRRRDRGYYSDEAVALLAAKLGGG